MVYEAKSLDDHKDYACKSISKAKLVTKVSTTSFHPCLAIDLLCFASFPAVTASVFSACNLQVNSNASFSSPSRPCYVTGRRGRHTERG